MSVVSDDGEYCCSKADANDWILECYQCNIKVCSDHMDEFSADCNCCHHDFCGKCCEIINKEETNRCVECIGDCNRRCHNGMECECDDDCPVDFSDDDECVDCNIKNNSVKYNEKKNKIICDDCIEWDENDDDNKRVTLQDIINKRRNNNL